LNPPEFKNPYKPGAGHMPPHLAGREREYEEFGQLLEQDEILNNVVLTGLRGVGKTVLLETFKPRAVEKGWFWVTADLSESASISETALAQRLLADLSLVTASLTVERPTGARVGFSAAPEAEQIPLSHGLLTSVYEETPGLVADRIKATLEFAWEHLRERGRHKVIFAYDEAQNLADHADSEQFPLSDPAEGDSLHARLGRTADAVPQARRRPDLCRAHVSGHDPEQAQLGRESGSDSETH
jgi:Cdc6-like AAA superfamily ATPase